jgi:hypothetical protein
MNKRFKNRLLNFIGFSFGALQAKQQGGCGCGCVGEGGGGTGVGWMCGWAGEIFYRPFVVCF